MATFRQDQTEDPNLKERPDKDLTNSRKSGLLVNKAGVYVPGPKLIFPTINLSRTFFPLMHLFHRFYANFSSISLFLFFYFKFSPSYSCNIFFVPRDKS
jgi:hypothetical protein